MLFRQILCTVCIYFFQDAVQASHYVALGKGWSSIIFKAIGAEI